MGEKNKDFHRNVLIEVANRKASRRVDLIHDGCHVGYHANQLHTSQGANNTNSRDYNEDLSHAGDLRQVH